MKLLITCVTCKTPSKLVTFLILRYYGGWVCKNIYYLGHTGVIRVGGLRIGGVSGIHYGRDYRRGYYEQEPFTYEMIRSAYHYREFEIEKLKRVKRLKCNHFNYW